MVEGSPSSEADIAHAIMELTKRLSLLEERRGSDQGSPIDEEIATIRDGLRRLQETREL